jgi:hypothetical protein
MGRRKRNILNDLVVMPWWCSPLAAIIAYVVDLQLILSHSPAHPGGSRDTPWLPPCPTRDLPRVDHSAAQVTASDANREPLQAVRRVRGFRGFWISGFLGLENSHTPSDFGTMSVAHPPAIVGRCVSHNSMNPL